MQQVRRYGLTALKVGASVGLVWWVLRDVHLGEAWRLLRGVSTVALGGVALALVVKAATGVARWRLVLRQLDAHLSAGRTLAILLLGAFFNQCLPSSIGGDGVRVLQARRSGLSLGVAARSVLLDRLAGMLALLGMVAVGAPLFHAWGGDVWVVVTALVMGGGGLAGLGLLAWASAHGRPRGEGRAARALRRLGDDLRTLGARPRAAAPIMAWAVAFQAAQVAVAWIGALGLGVDLGLGEALVLLPAVLLVTMVPVSLAGWGVREVATVTALSVVGVPAEQAVVVSVLYGLALLVFGRRGGGMGGLALGHGRDGAAARGAT